MEESRQLRRRIHSHNRRNGRHTHSDMGKYFKVEVTRAVYAGNIESTEAGPVVGIDLTNDTCINLGSGADVTLLLAGTSTFSGGLGHAAGLDVDGTLTILSAMGGSEDNIECLIMAVRLYSWHPNYIGKSLYPGRHGERRWWYPDGASTVIR